MLLNVELPVGPHEHKAEHGRRQNGQYRRGAIHSEGDGVSWRVLGGVHVGCINARDIADLWSGNELARWRGTGVVRSTMEGLC